MGPPSRFFYTEQSYTIFALIAEEDGDLFAYIGKTTSSDYKAIVRRHYRAEVALTSPYFSENSCNSRPRFLVLEKLTCTGSVAYRHILSWIRIFDDHQFMTIAYPRTDWQAYHMLTETEAIYENILKLPIDEILHQCYRKGDT